MILSILATLPLACAKPTLVLDLAGAPPKPIGVALDATCMDSIDTLELVHAPCRDVEAGEPSVAFPVELAEEDLIALGCMFHLVVTSSCDPAKLTLMVADFAGTVFELEGPQPAITVPANQFNTAFDEDSDGFTNWDEHVAGSDPRSADSRPAPL